MAEVDILITEFRRRSTLSVHYRMYPSGWWKPLMLPKVGSLRPSGLEHLRVRYGCNDPEN